MMMDRTSRWKQKASGHLEQSALAATARSDHRDELATINLEADKLILEDIAFEAEDVLGS